ncbi:myoD family inhibitor domain-containing protein 2-like, partial [Hemitrygon akajei]|uniref:myoD family inhibitor domain-containing protein 2-like n=1 Tax=Hemitrygon akajei TaxID=2704970 RepID=UPI003BF98F55
ASPALHAWSPFSRDPPQPTTSPLPSQLSTSPGEDLCVSLLLSCLFCRPGDGCALLPALCPSPAPCRGCGPPELGATTGGQALRGCRALWDCSLLEPCQQSAECLELALEISELCYH